LGLLQLLLLTSVFTTRPSLPDTDKDYETKLSGGVRNDPPSINKSILQDSRGD